MTAIISMGAVFALGVIIYQLYISAQGDKICFT